jgi:hypothetical protein
MGYQILQGDPTEYEVIEYPSFADERAFTRLLLRTDTNIVSQQEKEDLCKKWAWDPEEVCSEGVSGYVEYHLQLAKTILQGTDSLTREDAEHLRPGKLQEARVDFIQGCQGRSDGQGSGSPQGLMAAMRSLLGQNETQTATTGTD